MANERTRVSDIQDDELDARVVDKWPADTDGMTVTSTGFTFVGEPVEVDCRGRAPFTVPSPLEITGELIMAYLDPLDWPTLIAGVRGCEGCP